MLLEAEFWVLVSFLIFLAIVWKVGGGKALIRGLDARAERIKAELAEAQRLRDEAQSLLAGYEHRRSEAEREASEIVASAREEAERLARETEAKMAEFVRRRTAAAEAKIAQAEAQAAAEVRAAAVEAAVKASERILRSELAGPAAEALVTKSLGDVRKRLNA
jgi:F-type H+-transporting ATPase subunit b